MTEFELTHIKAVKCELSKVLDKTILLDDFPSFMVEKASMHDSNTNDSPVDKFFVDMCSYADYDTCQTVVGYVNSIRKIWPGMKEEDKNTNAYRGMNRCAVFEFLNGLLHRLDDTLRHFNRFDYESLEFSINQSFPEDSKYREFGCIRHEWYRVNAYITMMTSIIQYAAFEVINALYTCVDVKVTEPTMTSKGLKVFYYDDDDVMTIQQWMLDEARK